MLSRSERRFVQDPEGFPKSQVWVHRCRINKKIRKFVSDLHTIIEKNDELHLNLQLLDELFETKRALQNSERAGQETVSDSAGGRNSILDRYKNW